MKIIKFFLQPFYLFQVLEYRRSNFLKSIRKNFTPKHFKGRLIYTGKIKLLIFLVLLLQFLSLSFYWFLFPIIFLLTPLYLLFASIIIWPLEIFIKYYFVFRAKQKINRNIKIIAVTGSYGKTTTTQFIYNLLKNDYKVFTPKSGFNTLLGISKEIVKHMPQNTEILVLEMGMYRLGEIKTLCKYFPPDISVITSIGTQHIERLKTKENIIKAKSEIIQYAKRNAVIILPKEVYDLIPHLSDKNFIIAEFTIQNFENLKTYFRVKNETFYTKLLGLHIISDLVIAITCARLFNIEDLVQKVALLKTSERRMNVQVKNDVVFVDDSYNIGFESASEAVNFLSKIKSNRLIVFTGGIVELGKFSEEKNSEYGKLLNQKADQVTLYNTPYKKYMKKFIDPRKIIQNPVFEKGDIVLFQNEIPDQYFINSSS